MPELTVEENLFLGREFDRRGFVLNRAAMRARARAILRELNFDLEPDRKVSQSVARPPANGGDRQGVPDRTSGS